MTALFHTGNPPTAAGFVLISHCLINIDLLLVRSLLWLSAIVSTCEEIASVKLGYCLMQSWLFYEECSETFNNRLLTIPPQPASSGTIS